MHNRLFISNGPYTSLILSTLISPLPHSSKDFNVLLGYFKNINNQTKQVSLLDETFFTRDLSLFTYKKFLRFNYKYFKSHTNYRKFDSIYIPINTNTVKWYKIFKKLYPNAEFNLYEEGLLSYIKPIFSRKLRNIMQKTTNYYVLHNVYLKNMLAHYCPQIMFTSIDKQALVNNVTKIKTKFNLTSSFLQKDKKQVIILPQYYYQNNKKKYTVLIDNYINYIQQFINQGYSVFFKDHPKSNASLYNLLKIKLQNNPNFSLLPDNDELPIEVLIHNTQQLSIFSVYSTALFTLPYLYNIPALTSLKMLEDRTKWLSFFPALSCTLVKKIIPNIENQPPELPAVENCFKTNVENCFKTNNKMLNYFINLSRKIL